MTTKGSSGCQCGHCYVNGSCTDCLECYPHYLCASLIAHPDVDVCCKKIYVLMYHTCKGAWSGSTVCNGETYTFSASIDEDDYGNCYYQVSLNGSVVFSDYVDDRVLPSIEMDYGSAYTLRVSAGIGNKSPDFSNACGSCKCAKCLPQSYCVRVQVSPLTSYGLCLECTSVGTLTCTPGSNGYTGTVTCGDKVFDFVLSLIPNTCSGTLVITCEEDSKEISVGWESLITPADGATRHECLHGPFASRVTRGYTGRPAGVEDQYAITSDGFDTYLDIADGAARATFTITPKWCGDCEIPSSTLCPGGCPTISNSCDPYCGSTTLYGEILAPNCDMDGTAFELESCNTIYTPDRTIYWPAETRPHCQLHVTYKLDPYLGIRNARTYYVCGSAVPNATYFTAELYYLRKTGCSDPTVDINNYVLHLAFYAGCSGPPPTPYAQEFLLSPVSGSCEPFSLDFEFTPPSNVGPCICCYGSDTATIRVTE